MNVFEGFAWLYCLAVVFMGGWLFGYLVAARRMFLKNQDREAAVTRMAGTFCDTLAANASAQLKMVNAMGKLRSNAVTVEVDMTLLTQAANAAGYVLQRVTPSQGEKAH